MGVRKENLMEHRFNAYIKRSVEYLDEKFIHLIIDRDGIKQQVSFLSSEEISYVISLLETAEAMLQKVENK